MLKKYLATLIVAILLLMAIARVSDSLAGRLAALAAPGDQAIACNTSSGSGGGC